MRVFILGLILGLLGLGTHAISCVDEANEPVDWWWAIKFPSNASKEYDGFRYGIVTSSAPEMVVSPHGVTSNVSIMGRTLAPIYADAAAGGDAITHVFYNDQLPNGSWTLDYAHSKGALALDGDDVGFWMTHSAGKFPNYPEKGYRYNYGQLKYGQHLACFSLRDGAAAVDALASAMLTANPFFRRCFFFSFFVSGRRVAVVGGSTRPRSTRARTSGGSAT